MKFEYDLADPESVTVNSEDHDWNPDHSYSYALGSTGKIRLWNKKSDASREKAAAPDGDCLPSGEWIKWSELFGSEAEAKIFLEAVRPSEALGDLSIKVTLRENTEEDPEEEESMVESSDEVYLTGLEISSEPVKTTKESPLVGHSSVPINPAGVSSAIGPGFFELVVMPDNYPKKKIGTIEKTVGNRPNIMYLSAESINPSAAEPVPVGEESCPQGSAARMGPKLVGAAGSCGQLSGARMSAGTRLGGWPAGAVRVKSAHGC